MGDGDVVAVGGGVGGGPLALVACMGQQEGHLPPETVRELGLVHGTVFTLLGRTGYYVRAGSIPAEAAYSRL